MSQSSTPKLTCGQCGYENEPERVYCHNCGTKLDRSVSSVLAESYVPDSLVAESVV